MTNADFLRVGLVLKPHGVKGAIKLLPLTSDVERFKALKEAFLELEEGLVPVSVTLESIRNDTEVYVTLSGYETRESAELLRNVYLCVDRKNAVKLPKGHYFVADLIGCRVSDTNGVSYGVLEEVLQNGAADVYVIRGEKTLMVPALKKLLTDVNVQEKQMVLNSEVLKEVGLFED